MVMRVTGRGRNGRGYLSPRSHVLTKAVGQTISASWSVTNTGGVSGFGALDIVFPDLGTGFFGTLANIPAGATITLSVSGVITTLTPGTHAAQLKVTAAAPATVAPGGVHPFTVTIPALAETVTKAQILAEAQSFSTTIPCPDTKFWVGTALVLHNMINDPNPQAFVDEQSGTGLCFGFTWDIAWEFWISSGKVFTDRIVG